MGVDDEAELAVDEYNDELNGVVGDEANGDGNVEPDELDCGGLFLLLLLFLCSDIGLGVSDVVFVGCGVGGCELLLLLLVLLLLLLNTII